LTQTLIFGDELKMRKIFTFFTILAAMLFALAACGGAATDQYDGLVGTWHWNADGAYVYTFNYDGTGERGFPETHQTFTWATRGDRLEITRDYILRPREIQNEAWTFYIYDYILTMTSNNQEDLYFVYERAATEHPEELVGVWAASLDSSYLVTLNEDGTGRRGRGSEAETFRWATDYERLNIIRDEAPVGMIRGEMWNFEVYEETLTLTNRQDEYAPERTFYRAEQ
jgi:hypothetical protein